MSSKVIISIDSKEESITIDIDDDISDHNIVCAAAAIFTYLWEFEETVTEQKLADNLARFVTSDCIGGTIDIDYGKLCRLLAQKLI